MASAPPRPKTLDAPFADNASLTTREKIILLRNSKLYGCKFPPWDKAPGREEFEGDYHDDSVFHFSAEQQETFQGWKSPESSAGYRGVAYSKAVDLVQDVTTDCSVVASLCSLTARAESLGSDEESILSNVIHPSDRSSPNGKYVFKLNFNGCFRRVEIDDRLPVSKTSRTLHVIDRKDSSLLWPALVEKAYLKARGGYDFPGSNSGTDLWILTGWIPEQLFLQSEEVVPNTLWKRLVSGFQFGDALITLGTGSLSHKEEQATNLVGDHAYAVIGLSEEVGSRSLLVKNPWSKGTLWQETNAQDNSTRTPARPGTVWKSFDQILQNFETIYLNWNPGLFKYRKDAHFTWDLSSRTSAASFDNNPQFTLRCKDAKNTVWLLLSKHFQDFDREEVAADSRDPRLQVGFLSLYAFENEYRVTLPDAFVKRSEYVDAPNVLLKLEPNAGTTYTVVVSEQQFPSQPFDFSLSAFSLQKVDLKVAERKLKHCTSQQGAWTLSSAGGNSGSPLFSNNPQFVLTIPSSSDISIICESHEPEAAVNVKLVWAKGKRIPPKITNRDIYGDSGEYRRGCAMLEVQKALPGVYTVICSTFKQGQLGKFTVKVWSVSESCVLRAIATESPGKLVFKVKNASFTMGIDKVLARLKVARLSRVQARAKSLENRGLPSSSPLKLTIEFGQGSNAKCLASTGEFTDSAGGILTTEVDVKSGMCKKDAPGVWIALERVGGSSFPEPEEVQVEIFSNEGGVELDEWILESDSAVEEVRRRMAKSSVSLNYDDW